MHKIFLFFLSILTILALVLSDTPHKIKAYYISNTDIQSTETYKSLDALLTKWCDEKYLVKPELYIRFNKTDEGYYQTNRISLLVSPETYFSSSDFLEVALAHEFGHHYVRIQNIEDLTPEKEEEMADLVALDLIGLQKIQKVLIHESSRRDGGDESHRSFKSRLEFLNQSQSRSLKK